MSLSKNIGKCRKCGFPMYQCKCHFNIIAEPMSKEQTPIERLINFQLKHFNIGSDEYNELGHIWQDIKEELNEVNSFWCGKLDEAYKASKVIFKDSKPLEGEELKHLNEFTDRTIPPKRRENLNCDSAEEFYIKNIPDNPTLKDQSKILESYKDQEIEKLRDELHEEEAKKVEHSLTALLRMNEDLLNQLKNTVTLEQLEEEVNDAFEEGWTQGYNIAKGNAIIIGNKLTSEQYFQNEVLPKYK